MRTCRRYNQSQQAAIGSFMLFCSAPIRRILEGWRQQTDGSILYLAVRSDIAHRISLYIKNRPSTHSPPNLTTNTKCARNDQCLSGNNYVPRTLPKNVVIIQISHEGSNLLSGLQACARLSKYVLCKFGSYVGGYRKPNLGRVRRNKKQLLSRGVWNRAPLMPPVT